jgi:hypothetical protein
VDRLPDPGPFLADVRLLAGDDHLAAQQLVREAFEERGVYDATFGYNLAALNGLDDRHDYAVVRVRLRNHQAADQVNDDLRERAGRYLESGTTSGAGGDAEDL